MPGSVKITGKTAIIAGGGALPAAVAAKLAAQGAEPFIVLLRGNADNEGADKGGESAALRRYPHQLFGITELAKFLQLMKAEKIHNLVLAGSVAQRPNLRDLRWDWPTLKTLPHIFAALRRGDDALLRAFIGVMEGYGFRVIGAHEIVPELLAPQSAAAAEHFILTKRRANKTEQADIAAAKEAARRLGELDIGQGAVAVGGRVVALEGAEGTDAMLERVAELRRRGKIPPKGGALVKMKKPNQEMRADLPTIGPETILRLAGAGLTGLAVEAGGSFIIDEKKTVQLADKKKLFLQSL